MGYNLLVRIAATRQPVRLFQQVYLFAQAEGHPLILQVARLMLVQAAAGKNA